MKLPKELQKKKKQINYIQSNYPVLKKKLITSFKNEVKRITKNDSRKIIFKKAGDRSIFTDLIDDEIIKNESGLYNAKTHWDETIIEFYLDENDNNDYFKHLKQNPDDFVYLKPIIEYTARHEYGHTFLTKSSYDQIPKEEREILHKIGCKNFKSVPEAMQKDIFEEIRKTSYYICVEELVNLDLGFLLNEFKEFHANYTVLKKIDNKVPKEFLKWKYNQLKIIITNLKSEKKVIIENIKNSEEYKIFKKNEFFYLFIKILPFTFETYVFTEWDQLIPLFQNHNMINFLYFSHQINAIFEDIADNNIDFDSITENIMNLGHLMELMNYEKLIFNNCFPDKMQEKFKQFRNEFINII